MEQLILTYLKEMPPFRERKNKVRGLANLLIEKYHLDIPREKMMNIIDDVVAGERYWRKILQNYPEYRGQDYDTKKKVVQKTQINLGYEPHYHQRIKIR